MALAAAHGVPQAAAEKEAWELELAEKETEGREAALAP
jgi:hypothetical protein